MDELREKLVAQDAGVDDRLVELLKVFLVNDHPVLLRRARLRLTLDAVTDKDFEFVANYEHHPQSFRVSMPAEIVKGIAKKPDDIKAWVRKAHPKSGLFESDHWVNMWRWSPQPTALERLKGFAEQIRQGENIDPEAAAFVQMLDGIPRGNHLPSWAKQDLRTLFEFAKAKNFQKLEATLFKIRFGVELEDDWSLNQDVEDIDTLWKLLKDLPDTNVEGNTKLHEILLNVGEGGGVYSPQSFDISIGSNELANREGFEDVMRHEVGHAVHEMKADIVNNWLTTQFGWQVFGLSDGEIDQWVDLMGGWGDLTSGQKDDVRQALRIAIGVGNEWTPGPTPTLTPGHPWYAPDFGPRLAFEKTGANWFRNNKNWYRANGKAFYLNFYYQNLIAVNTTTLDLVAQMPSDYASMSQFEFFAELYALYYDLDDPKRAAIPKNVATWLETNIGAPEVAAPMPAPPGEKQPWETIDRPNEESENN